jgi:hypothetical protein
MKSTQIKQKQEREQDIEWLTKQLESLQIQVSTLRQELKVLMEQDSKTKTKDRNKGDIRIGDRVIVLNKHRSLKNTVGTVISVAAVQATVRPDNGEPDFRRYKINLKLV